MPVEIKIWVFMVTSITNNIYCRVTLMHLGLNIKDDLLLYSFLVVFIFWMHPFQPAFFSCINSTIS